MHTAIDIAMIDIQYVDDWRDSMAHQPSRNIKMPKPDNLWLQLVGFHEMGHIVLGYDYRTFLRDETRAEVWAYREIRRLGGRTSKMTRGLTHICLAAEYRREGSSDKKHQKWLKRNTPELYAIWTGHNMHREDTMIDKCYKHWLENHYQEALR